MLALPPHSKKVLGSIPAWGAVGTGGSFSAQVGYLPGRSVWSLHVLPVFTRVFLHLEPRQKKHAKEQITLLSVPDQDGHDHLTWSPGAIKAAHCSWLLRRKDSPGWDKCRGYISLRPLRHACVCVLCRHPKNAHVCCCVSCVTIIN